MSSAKTVVRGSVVLSAPLSHVKNNVFYDIGSEIQISKNTGHLVHNLLLLKQFLIEAFAFLATLANGHENVFKCSCPCICVMYCAHIYAKSRMDFGIQLRMLHLFMKFYQRVN